MDDPEPYVILTIPIVVLTAVYAILGFELAVVVGLGMAVGQIAVPEP